MRTRRGWLCDLCAEAISSGRHTGWQHWPGQDMHFCPACTAEQGHRKATRSYRRTIDSLTRHPQFRGAA